MDQSEKDTMIALSGYSQKSATEELSAAAKAARRMISLQKRKKHPFAHMLYQKSKTRLTVPIKIDNNRSNMADTLMAEYLNDNDVSESDDDCDDSDSDDTGNMMVTPEPKPKSEIMIYIESRTRIDSAILQSYRYANFDVIDIRTYIDKYATGINMIPTMMHEIQFSGKYPEMMNVYYDNSDGKTYVYTRGDWMVISMDELYRELIDIYKRYYTHQYNYNDDIRNDSRNNKYKREVADCIAVELRQKLKQVTINMIKTRTLDLNLITIV
jgi:hypothetical protein